MLLYCLYAPQVVGLVALFFIPSERIAVWMLWLREWTGPQLNFSKGSLVICILTIFIHGPAFVALTVARVLKKRQLRYLCGRCLNCGDTRLSEFLEDCSKCGSQFKEQDQYRNIAKARLLRRPPAGIRRLVENLQSFRRDTLFVTAISVTLFLATCTWGHLNESSTKPPRPATSACLIFSGLLLMASLAMFSVMSFRCTRVNLLRLKGCCLKCEKPLGDEITCNHCGSSIVAQQLWVQRILFQNSGFAGPQVMNFAKELGISSQIRLRKM